MPALEVEAGPEPGPGLVPGGQPGPLAELVRGRLGRPAAVAHHLGVQPVRRDPAAVAQHLGRHLERPPRAVPVRLGRRQRQVEVQADVDDHPGRPQRRALEHAEPAARACRTSRARRPAAPRTAPSPRSGRARRRPAGAGTAPSPITLAWPSCRWWPGTPSWKTVVCSAQTANRSRSPSGHQVRPGPGERLVRRRVVGRARSWNRSRASRRPCAAAARCRSARRPAARSPRRAAPAARPGTRRRRRPRRSRPAARSPPRCRHPGRDPLGLGGQLVLDPVQLGPGPLVRLDRVEVGAEHEPAGDRVPLRADAVGLGRPRRVDPAQPVGPCSRTRRARRRRRRPARRRERAVAVRARRPGSWVAPSRTGRPAAPASTACRRAAGSRGRGRAASAVPPGRQHRRDRGQPGRRPRPSRRRRLRHQVDAVPDGGEQAERRAQGRSGSPISTAASSACSRPRRNSAAATSRAACSPVPLPGSDDRPPAGAAASSSASVARAQVGAGPDALGSVVGGHPGGTGDAAHRAPHRVQGRLSPHVPFAHLEDRARHGG